MADDKAAPEQYQVPHPSETLEFVTSIVVQPQAEHIEFASRDCSDDVHPKFKPMPASDSSSTDHMARLNHLIHISNESVDAEHRMTIRDALRLYPKAIGWSMLLSLTIVMEGYDLTIVNSFYAFPEFKKAYGEQVGDNDYQISTAWQSGLTNGAIVGEILGLLFNGHLTERFGYRKSLIYALLALIVFIFLAVFAFNIGMLMASEVLCGLSWGVFQTLSTTYAAEIMPVALRAYLTSNVNLCWLIGQIIGTGVLRGLINLQSEWSYRIPFSLQCQFSFAKLASRTANT
jgi:SP family general alpha glucoside:H+ symporter-like MFS transporter